MAGFDRLVQQPSDQEIEKLDIENVLLDFRVDEEELQSAAKSSFGALNEMATRLSQLEDHLGAGKDASKIERDLLEAMGGKAQDEATREAYQSAAQQLEELEAFSFEDSFKVEVMLALCDASEPGPLAMVLTGSIPAPSGVRQGAAATAFGMLIGSSVRRAARVTTEGCEDASRAIERFLAEASRIEAAHQRFNDIWSKDVLEEENENPTEI